MHEYGIVESLLDRVDTEAAARSATSVRRLHVRIGELAGVDTELLATAFETFRRGLCAGAELRIVEVSATWVCPRCGAPLERGAVLRCPTCCVPARLEGGDEILLERIEMEVPDV
jgi:hydrogenase nickel incorporation protein HypA/HybF